MVHGNAGMDRGHNVAIEIHALLKWLFSKTSSCFANLFWQLLCSISCAMEMSDAVVGASANAMELPVPMGPQGKAMRIPNAEKDMMANIAARSRLLRSGQAVADVLHLLREDQGKFESLSANKWVSVLSRQYLHLIETAMTFGVTEPIYSISWDASRLSKRDTRIATLYNSELDLPVWCPPQVCFCLCSGE